MFPSTESMSQFTSVSEFFFPSLISPSISHYEMKMLTNNDLSVIPVVDYITQSLVDACKCSFELNFLRVRASINKNRQHCHEFEV